MQEKLTDQEWQKIQDNLKTVVVNNDFKSRELQLMQFGAVAVLTALFEQVPVGLTISAMAGRTIFDVEASPFTEPGEYALRGQRGTIMLDVDYNLDARDVALDYLGYHLGERPHIYEEEEV